MRCDDYQEAWSARLDGEPGDPAARVVTDAELDAHVARCPRCADFARGAEAVHRTVRVRAAEPVPDLADAILAVAPPVGARPPAARPEREWARYALLTVALTQLVLSIPALVLGDASGASTHLARELGSWDLALAVAWLVVAWSPRRAAGLIPFAAALAVVMVASALVDVGSGRVPLANESPHVLDVIGVGMVWLLARSTPSDRPLLPRLADLRRA